VHTAARAEALWAPDDTVLVAVSGGMDSVTLLHLLHAVAPAESLRLAVGHVDHGLRAESRTDLAFVADYATRLGVPCYMRRVDVRARMQACGESLEEAARELRYAALAEMAAEAGATRIATGHTADDQAETVLMRVLRGTGVSGLAGIPPRRDAIIRPLLPLWRHDVEAYIAAHGLAYRSDSSNADREILRNRLRLELLPQLEYLYAPQLRARLVHLAQMARDDDAVLDAQARAHYRAAARTQAGGVLLPPLDVPPALVRRAWRIAVTEVTGGCEDVSFEHLAAVAALPVGRAVSLPGVQVRREQDGYFFFRHAAAALTSAPLPVPGRVHWPDVGTLTATPAPLAPPVGGDTALLDADEVRGPLTVRAWQPGDRFCPYSAPGARPVQDIFTDAGVPRRLRTQVPVVEDADGIVWLAGFRIADRVKMTATTQAVLRLQIEWESNPWTSQRSNDA
jgi:tRNA(Ile)-lysidine synthase